MPTKVDTRTTRPHSFRRGGPWVLLLLVAVLASTGCVRRRLTVRSNPPGALVHVDNQRIGTTPCSVDYVYYGTREIRLSMQGYETLTVNQPIPAPWHQTPGIDFVTDNLIPYKIEDSRTVAFNLQRQRMAPAEEIIARGEGLRRQATPVGAAPIVPATAIEPGAPVYTPTVPYQTPAAAPQSVPPPAAAPFSPAPAQPFGATPPLTPQPQPAPPLVQPQPAPGLPDTFRY